MSIDLDQLAALHEAATPGEAFIGQTYPNAADNDYETVRHFVYTTKGVLAEVCSDENAALIAAMFNALPELIERVREAEERVQSLIAKVVSTDMEATRWCSKSCENEDRALAAESRVAHLEAGIKALADEWGKQDMSVDYGGTYFIAAPDAIAKLRVLLNGTDKETE